MGFRPLGLIVPCLLIACTSGPGHKSPKDRPADPSAVKVPSTLEWPAEPAVAVVPADSAPPPFPEAREFLDPDPGYVDPQALPDAPYADLALDSAQGKDRAGSDSSRVAAGDTPWKPVPSLARPQGILSRTRPKDLPEKVRVLIARPSNSITLYSLGDVQILAEGVATDSAGVKSVAVTKLAVLKGRLLLRRTGNGFTIEGGGKPAQITAARRLRIISANQYNLIDVGGVVYRGNLHVLGDPKTGRGRGEFAIVNVLGVEEYLRGVVPYELGNVDRDALEALKAQAIVARTYAYKRMMRPGNPDFHLFSDVQDQVYKGVRREYLLSDRAVRETSGMAVSHNDTLATCYYYSTCSGRTASKHEVWGGDSIPYLVSRPDVNSVGTPFCRASKYTTWDEQWTLAQLPGILKRNLRSAGVATFPDFKTVRGVEVTTRASCGRIRSLLIETEKGPIIVKGDKVRWALRPPASESKILPSASFELKTSGGRLEARGKAFGHGVGLCQYGAIARARERQDYREIIEAYYQGIRIVEFK